MNTLLFNYLSRIELGEAKRFKGITVVPVFTSANHTPDYLALTEALEQNVATISEANTGGTVSEIRVSNRSDRFLLLVEGEELIGAKQNRTLNTSILLAGKSETVVPVSCTERGRWGFKTRTFSNASFISPHKLRKIKSDSTIVVEHV